MAITKEQVLQVIETIIQHIVVLFFLLILWELFKHYSFKEIGTWHIILSTLGFALCMAEALLLFGKQNVLLKDVDRVTRGTYHALLMGLAFVCVTIGISLKIYQKNDAGRSHFTTTHGILGLTAWILAFIAVVLGIFVRYAKQFSHLARPIWFKLFHLFLGAASYIIGVVAVGYGLRYLEVYTSQNGKIALIVFLAIYVTYSLIGCAVTSFNLIFRR